MILRRCWEMKTQVMIKIGDCEVTNMNQFEMKKLAYQSQLRNRALQVLLYLIDRSNTEQTCFPAVPTISRELHISISTVKRAMRELVEAGYVAKESRFREGNRGQTSNLYILHFPVAEEVSEETAVSDKIVQTEQAEQTDQAGMETEPALKMAGEIKAAEEYKESLSEEKDIDKAKSVSVAENNDGIDALDAVLNRYGMVEQPDCRINQGNGVNTDNFAIAGRKGMRGYGKMLEVAGILLRKGSMIVCGFQWPGAGVNLIPP